MSTELPDTESRVQWIGPIESWDVTVDSWTVPMLRAMPQDGAGLVGAIEQSSWRTA